MKNALSTTAFAFTLVSGLAMTHTAHAGQYEIDQIEAAASQLDLTELQQLSQQMQGYDLALNQYRIALSANLTGQKDLASKAIDEAMTLLEKLDAESPESPEIKALLAQVYGYKIAISPLKGVYYGPKAGEALQQAKALAPNNPRVHLVAGISAFNTPAMFGGSIEVALSSFSKAIEAYKMDGQSDYHWGHAETFTWRGLVHQQQGDMQEARADWQKALEIEPGYGWANMLIAKNKG